MSTVPEADARIEALAAQEYDDAWCRPRCCHWGDSDHQQPDQGRAGTEPRNRVLCGWLRWPAPEAARKAGGDAQEDREAVRRDELFDHRKLADGRVGHGDVHSWLL